MGGGLRDWWRHILTGPDNQTVAIGRAIGLAVAAVFLFALPPVAFVLLQCDLITADDWKAVFSSLQVYVPAIVLSVAGLIGLTAPSEGKIKPKETDDA